MLTKLGIIMWVSELIGCRKNPQWILINQSQTMTQDTITIITMNRTGNDNNVFSVLWIIWVVLYGIVVFWDGIGGNDKCDDGGIPTLIFPMQNYTP